MTDLKVGMRVRARPFNFDDRHSDHPDGNAPFEGDPSVVEGVLNFTEFTSSFTGKKRRTYTVNDGRRIIVAEPETIEPLE